MYISQLAVLVSQRRTFSLVNRKHLDPRDRYPPLADSKESRLIWWLDRTIYREMRPFAGARRRPV